MRRCGCWWSSNRHLEIVSAIYQRQPPLQELIGNGWVVLAAKHPQTRRHPPLRSGQRLAALERRAGQPAALPAVERSADWFAGRRELLPPALLRRPVSA
jgi:hypothetical protein